MRRFVRRCVWFLIVVLVVGVADSAILSVLSPVVSTDVALRQFDDSKMSNVPVRLLGEMTNTVVWMSGIVLVGVAVVLFWSSASEAYRWIFSEKEKADA